MGCARFRQVQAEIATRAARRADVLATFAGFLGMLPVVMVEVTRTGADVVVRLLASGDLFEVWGHQTPEIETAPDGRYPAPYLVRDVLAYGKKVAMLEL